MPSLQTTQMTALLLSSIILSDITLSDITCPRGFKLEASAHGAAVLCRKLDGTRNWRCPVGSNWLKSADAPYCGGL